MSNELILIKGNLPAHIAALAGKARELNAAAAAGVSAGATPSLRIKNSRFRLVDGNDDIVIKAKDLVESTYLPVVVVGARAEINKAYYIKAYDPNQDEAAAPDCYSEDGKTPVADCEHPQCANCASCPQNVYGSGRNAAGQPTKGKACTDSKVLAVAYKSSVTNQMRVYSLKVPPASLKNWGAYVRALDSHDLPLGGVITFLSFDEEFDYPVLKFQAGGYVPDEKIGIFDDLAASPEAKFIVESRVSLPAPAKEQKAIEAKTDSPDPKKADQKKADQKKAAKAEAAAKEEAEKVHEPEVVEPEVVDEPQTATAVDEGTDDDAVAALLDL